MLTSFLFRCLKFVGLRRFASLLPFPFTLPSLIKFSIAAVTGKKCLKKKEEKVKLIVFVLGAIMVVISYLCRDLIIITNFAIRARGVS